MKDIQFVFDTELVKKNEAFIAHIPSVDDKEKLLKNLYLNLNFPENFGFNWDALLDCLCDLNWIDEQCVILVHDDLSGIDENNLKIYIEILIKSINTWNKIGFHYIEVIFSKKDIDIIKPFMNMVRI